MTRARCFALLSGGGIAPALCGGAMSIWLLGCGNCGSRAEPPAAVESAPALTADKDKKDVPAPAEPPESSAASKGLRPGWSMVALDNEVPLCVLADFEEQYKAQFIEQVEKQKLRADAPVVIGAFAGWCVNEGCDDRPSMQCSVRLEGNKLVVRSRYWGDRKDGATCTNVPCRPVTAGCETPPLPAGVYTVVHGERTFELRIPSVLRSPCFGTDVTTLPRPVPR